MVFEKIWNFWSFFVFFSNIQNNRSQKLSMLEKNKDSFGMYIEFHTKIYKAIFDFNFFILLLIFLFSVSKNMFFLTFDLQLKKFRAENWKSLCIVLCWIRCTFQNCLFFLALIVFDFCSFEGSKTHFTGDAYIYAYIEYY